MKRNIMFLLLVVLVLLFACSEKDNPTNVDNNTYGYSLDQFIPIPDIIAITDTTANEGTDFRGLYAYELVSSDGWSPRQSVNAGYDLSWESFKRGYLVPSDGNRTWFGVTTLPGAFKVRNTTNFNVYRKVDVVYSDSLSKLIELKGLQMHVINNWSNNPESAVKLSDILAGFSGYSSVKLEGIDGYNKTYTPDQIADGFYLLESEVTTFPSFNSQMEGGQKKFKKLARVIVLGATLNTAHAYLNAAHSDKDAVFAVPNSFSSFTRTVLENY